MKGVIVMKTKFWGVIASLLVLISGVCASSASWFVFYQPKEPKCLKH